MCNHITHYMDKQITTVLVLVVTVTTINCLLIDECPHRDVTTIRRTAQNWEIALIFYYTSWNNAVRPTRAVFETLASHYDGLAYFATVDCWHMHCNCSRTLQTATMSGTSSHGSPDVWPTMIVYFGQGTLSLQYHGEWRLNALSSFMESLLVPVERLDNRDDLRHLASKCESVVVGLFPDLSLKYHRQQYRRYLLAAVGWLATDPERIFRFAAVCGTNAVASLKGCGNTTMSCSNSTIGNNVPRILLLSQTAVMTFNSGGNVTVQSSQSKWHPRQIMQWVETELRRQIAHASNSGYTPTSLAIRIRNHSPVLIILANEAQLLTLLPGQERNKAVGRRCESLFSFLQQRDTYIIDETNNYIQQRQADDSQCRVHNFLQNAKDWANYYHLLFFLQLLFERLKVTDAHEHVGISDDMDETGSQQLLEWYWHKKCLQQPHSNIQELRIAAAKRLQLSVIDRAWAEQTVDRRIHNNRSMSLVILDANKHRDFLHQIGEQLEEAKNNVNININKAFIVDAHREQIYRSVQLKQQPLTVHNLLHFVRQYYNGHLREVVRKSQFVQMQDVHLQEYNRDMFMHLIGRQLCSNLFVCSSLPVLKNATTIVVLLYSPECAFSALYTQTLLQLSALLSTSSIVFIRINTLTNDLPWEFNIPETPSLLVFPHGQISESRLYPNELKVNVRNVLGFILARLEPTAQVSVVLDSCRQHALKLSSYQRQCLQFAKDLVMQHISSNLKYWQIFSEERRFIVNRLKMFKEFSLRIQKSSFGF